MITLLIVGGAAVVLAAVITVFATTPKARARRAKARQHRRDMADLRSRLGASARATYRKQFPNRRTGGSSYSSGDVSIGHFASDGGGDGGGGDCGGGGD